MPVIETKLQLRKEGAGCASCCPNHALLPLPGFGRQTHLLTCKPILPAIRATGSKAQGTVAAGTQVRIPRHAGSVLTHPAWDQGCLGDQAKRPPLGWVFLVNDGTAFSSSCLGNLRVPISCRGILPESRLWRGCAAGSAAVSDPHTERELTSGQEVFFMAAGHRLRAHPWRVVEVTLIQRWPCEKSPASPATISWVRTGARAPRGLSGRRGVAKVLIVLGHP